MQCLKEQRLTAHNLDLVQLRIKSPNGTASRSSYPEVLCKQGVLKKSQNSRERKNLLEFLFNKVAGTEACGFIKKRLRYSCFSVNFANILRTRLFTEQLRWLLLIILNYIIWYQIQTAHPLSRRITLSFIRIQLICIFP